MLTISTLGRRALGERMAGAGIDLRTGPFTTRLQSTIPSLVDGIALLYADYPLAEPGQFADFHVCLARPRGVRRWLRPQVEFRFDGRSMFQPLPLDHAFPMFEWGMNWCVSSHVHNHLIIHAAVVERDGCAAILPAPPGSGKSTLCAALVNNGWRLLSDELALVRPADGMLVPLPRPVSLKNASIEVVRRYVPDTTFSPAVRDTTKGTVAHLKAPRDSVARAAQLARPAWIVFPKFEAGAAARLEPLGAGRTFMDLAANSFNYSVLGPDGFEALAGVVDQSLGYRFTYSALDDALAMFSRLEPATP